MRIAILGTRGVPAKYGGFETCAEEISIRLVEKGHGVIAYCRKGNYDNNLQYYKGVKLVHLPSIKNKVTDTFSHTLFSMIHALTQNVDILYIMNVGNSPICVLPKVFRKRTVINVDGLEWKRKKWGKIARSYYLLAEKLSTLLSTKIISDSMAIKDYYIKKYKANSTFIAYGANIETSEKPEILNEYNLKPDEYFLVASRLEPENNADLTVKAINIVKTDKKLVIAGGANYKSRFIRDLMSTDDSRIIFLGPVYKKGHIKELHCNCFAYIHGNEVGGTNPALLKALGYGNVVLALDVPYNSEVIKDAGILYEKSVSDLAGKIQYLVDHPEVRKGYRSKAIQRIREDYTWEKIADQYEQLFLDMLHAR
jgi:glycosyltransferase involved in cell wall biosynthesis